MPVEANIATQPSLSIRTKRVLEIEAAQEGYSVSVGKWQSPELIARTPEVWFELKDEILKANGIPLPNLSSTIDPWGEPSPAAKAAFGAKIKEAHQHYKRHLGPKFYRRLSAVTWIVHVGWMPKDLWRFTKNDGRDWRFPNRSAIYAAQRMREQVLTAHRDGLPHLVPLIIAFEQDPMEMRATLGRALWRRLANNSPTRNHKLAQALLKIPRKDRNWACEHIAGIKSSNLHKCHLSLRPAEQLAHADRISTCATFTEAVMLVHDAQIMGRYNPQWGLARLRREHDREAERRASADYSAAPFAAPHVVEVDGFTFTRLVSPLEVAKEGLLQRHCVAGYAQHCANKMYAVYRVEGRERATLGIHLQHGRPWGIDQLQGACNAPVSDACRTAAIDLIHDDEFREEWAA